MDKSIKYNGCLTAEQFLFYEMRIVAKLYLEGQTIEDIIEYIKKDNLFQYPTERKISKMSRACYKRIVALDNPKLVYELVNAPVDEAKQINLYAMMCYNRLVREFMVDLIGEKYRQQDFSFTKKDINMFFLRLRQQNDEIAAWSEQTVAKLKQVLTRCLTEAMMLNSYNASELNPIFISDSLVNGIKEKNDFIALSAFNFFM